MTTSTNIEMFMIYNTLKTLDMEDALIDFYKNTPYNNYLNYKEYAPCNLLLETPCDYENVCFYKKEPLSCCKNHQTKNTIIQQGEQIPKYLCKYERPWKYLNGYPMRCLNINCWYSHLSGRKDILLWKLNNMNYNF
jgi:hypothetical protein